MQSGLTTRHRAVTAARVEEESWGRLGAELVCRRCSGEVKSLDSIKSETRIACLAFYAVLPFGLHSAWVGDLGITWAGGIWSRV